MSIMPNLGAVPVSGVIITKESSYFCIVFHLIGGTRKAAK